MPDALAYATPRSGPPGILLEEGDGGSVRITIPPPPVWPAAVGLSVGMILAGLGTLLGMFGLAVAIRGEANWHSGVMAAIAALSLGVVVVRLARRAWRLPRMGAVPTVVEADAEGLSISTARRGQLEHLYYPARRMLAVGIFPGPLSGALRRTMRIAMRIAPEGSLTGRETVVFEFDPGRGGRPAPLDAALRNALRLEPSAAPEARMLRYEMILRRI